MYATLRKIWGTWDRADPSHVEEALRAATRDPRLSCPRARVRRHAVRAGSRPARRSESRARFDPSARLRRPMADRRPIRQRGQGGTRHPERAGARAAAGDRAGQGLHRKRATRALSARSRGVSVRLPGRGLAGAPGIEGLRVCDGFRERAQGQAQAERVGRRRRLVQVVLERRSRAARQRVPRPRLRPLGDFGRSRAGSERAHAQAVRRRCLARRFGTRGRTGWRARPDVDLFQRLAAKPSLRQSLRQEKSQRQAARARGPRRPHPTVSKADRGQKSRTCRARSLRALLGRYRRRRPGAPRGA